MGSQSNVRSQSNSGYIAGNGDLSILLIHLVICEDLNDPLFFRGHPFSTYAKLSTKLTFLRNVSFSENFAYVLNGWPRSLLDIAHSDASQFWKEIYWWLLTMRNSVCRFHSILTLMTNISITSHASISSNITILEILILTSYCSTVNDYCE